MNIVKCSALAALAALALALGACTSTQSTLRSSGTDPVQSRARQAEQAGDLDTAARLYRQLADAAAGTVRAGYLLEAARLAIALGDTMVGEQWLREAEAVADDTQRQAVAVRLADIDVRENRAANALARLAELQEPVPMPLMIEAESVRGRALFGLGRTVDAVRTLVERETWLDTSNAILENQQMIWEGLAADGAAQAEPTGDPILDGWLALAPLAASDSSGMELRGPLLDWRRNYMNHPAAAALLAELLSPERGTVAYPAQIALLLPLTSQARAQAIAIRDGFLAAHFAARASDGPGAGAAIRVYDTALLGTEEAYQRAQLEGANFIVGPLLRPEVDRIVAQAGLVPTLALNNVLEADPSFVSGFYQFALAPEDETRAVARQAFADGARTAVALVPSDTWGYRLLNSFQAEFEALGGRFLGFNGYQQTAQDFSAPIESLLNLDRSEQRHTRLAANLGVPVSFEPRRRQDVDMIFLAVPDRDVARLLVPALRFHFAGDIPTYANPDVYLPSDSAGDGDLNNIYFPDAPWLLTPDANGAQLRRTLQNYWPQRTSSSLRFYGMGVDAYGLVGALYGGSSDWPIHGLSGDLELDVSGRVHRVLPFAQFRNGRPVALEPLRTPEPGTGLERIEEIAGAQ